ncbi:MAG: hypothetical protein ACP5N5_05385 [Desulfurococcus sp.]
MSIFIQPITMNIAITEVLLSSMSSLLNGLQGALRRYSCSTL